MCGIVGDLPYAPHIISGLSVSYDGLVGYLRRETEKL